MEAVILIGIQGAGKTTFYRERFFETHIRLSLDVLKTRARERRLVAALIEMQQPFVADNTNPTVADRARYILSAKSAGFRVTGYFFETTLVDALRRNALRAGKARVPPPAIGGTLKKLQIPTFEEGFDQLFHVSIDPAGGFIVEESAKTVPQSLGGQITGCSTTGAAQSTGSGADRLTCRPSPCSGLRG